MAMRFALAALAAVLIPSGASIFAQDPAPASADEELLRSQLEVARRIVDLRENLTKQLQGMVASGVATTEALTRARIQFAHARFEVVALRIRLAEETGSSTIELLGEQIALFDSLRGTAEAAVEQARARFAAGAAPSSAVTEAELAILEAVRRGLETRRELGAADRRVRSRARQARLQDGRIELLEERLATTRMLVKQGESLRDSGRLGMEGLETIRASADEALAQLLRAKEERAALTPGAGARARIIALLDEQLVLAESDIERAVMRLRSNDLLYKAGRISASQAHGAGRTLLEARLRALELRHRRDALLVR